MGSLGAKVMNEWSGGEDIFISTYSGFMLLAAVATFPLCLFRSKTTNLELCLPWPYVHPHINFGLYEALFIDPSYCELHAARCALRLSPSKSPGLAWA